MKWAGAWGLRRNEVRIGMAKPFHSQLQMVEGREVALPDENFPGRMIHVDLVSQNGNQQVFVAAYPSTHGSLQARALGNSTVSGMRVARGADVAFLMDHASPRKPTTRLTSHPH